MGYIFRITNDLISGVGGASCVSTIFIYLSFEKTEFVRSFEDKERMLSVIRTILENPRGTLALKICLETPALMSSMRNRQSYRMYMHGLGSQGDGTWISLLPTSKRVTWVKFGPFLKVL